MKLTLALILLPTLALAEDLPNEKWTTENNGGAIFDNWEGVGYRNPEPHLVDRFERLEAVNPGGRNVGTDKFDQKGDYVRSHVAMVDSGGADNVTVTVNKKPLQADVWDWGTVTIEKKTGKQIKEVLGK